MDWAIAPCSGAEVEALAEQLGIGEITASVLVRRGFGDPAHARAHLDSEQPLHDPLLLGDMEAACDAIRRAISQKQPICVHGDYDVDGVCATALAVLVLRELGAEVSWHLPSRFDEGYGLSGQTLSRLATEGCGLVLTVDCGITAAEEIAEAGRCGLGVVVTDHHRPAERLPDCPLVVTRPSEYPFPELCGTGVVYKLAQALLDPASDSLERHLDLVALATIADVVPLVDENRSLTVRGLRELARTKKSGLRALMRSAHVDAACLDAGAVGFRLAPRINAAGRLGHPGTALELLLTDDDGRAAELAASLEQVNRDRQGVEERILREAVAQVESWPGERRRRRGYVVAGEEWHQGVIGIVASRLVERYHRPVVLIAGGKDGWKGSGRSVAAYDLHAGLAACASHLERFGGHRAAAGLSLLPERLDAFAEAFAAHASAALTDEDLREPMVVDAVVPAKELTLELAGELGRLAPFGLGNPGVTLLVTGCEVGEPSATADGRHLRFRLRQGGRDGGSAIAFGLGAQLDRFRRVGNFDVAFRLEEDHWNGMVAPQLMVRRIFDTPERYEELRSRLAAEWKAGEEAWSAEARAIFLELGLQQNGAPWRSLLESPTFRALLEEQPSLALAA